MGPQCGMLTMRCGPTAPALQWPREGYIGVAIDLVVSELKSTDSVCGRRQSGWGPPGVFWRTSYSGTPSVVVQLAGGH